MSIVFFDTETGGLQPEHPTIQLAAVAVDSEWNDLGCFERKITFDPKTADAEALKVNRYDPDAWKDARPEGEVVREFARFLGSHASINMTSKRTGSLYGVARLAGHNAASFDGPRLKQMFARYNAFLPAHPLVLCTMQRAMWWFTEHQVEIDSLKLETVCKYFRVELSEAHDALVDCRASIAIAKAMKEPRPYDNP